MILAAIDGQVVIILLMALFGFISWLSGKLNPGDKQQPPSPPQPRRPGGSASRAPKDSEEERMRRFLEALGLPTDQPPVPHQPVRPAPVKRQLETAPPPLPARPRHVPMPPPIPEPFEPAPVLARMEPVEIVIPEVRDFPPARPAVAVATATTVPPSGGSLPELIRATLASPQHLRSAFLLREVLGPPIALRRD